MPWFEFSLSRFLAETGTELAGECSLKVLIFEETMDSKLIRQPIEKVGWCDYCIFQMLLMQVSKELHYFFLVNFTLLWPFSLLFSNFFCHLYIN